MASNLSLEGLSPIVERLDLQGQGGIRNNGSASSNGIVREMEQNGLSTPEIKGTFADLLVQSVSKVNQQQQQSDHAIQELVAGRTKNIHETMLAVERADMSLKMLMQVRNKVLDAYREIMRMQV